MTLAEQIRRNREILKGGDYTNRMSTRQTPTSTATISRPITPTPVRTMPVNTQTTMLGVGSVTPSATLSKPQEQINKSTLGIQNIDKAVTGEFLSPIVKGTGNIVESVGSAISSIGKPFTGGRTTLEQAAAIGRGEVSPILGGPAMAIKAGTGLVGGTFEGWGRTIKSIGEKGFQKTFDYNKLFDTYKEEGLLGALASQEAENFLNLTDVIPGAKAGVEVTERGVSLIALGLLKNADKTDDIVRMSKNLGKFDDITRNTSQIIRKGGLVDNNVKFSTNIDELGNVKVTTQFREGPLVTEGLLELDGRTALPGQVERGIVDDVRESTWIPESFRTRYKSFYTPQAAEPEFMAATQLVEDNLEKTLKDFKNADISPDQTTPTAWALANKLFEEGRDADALDVIDILGKRSTQFGQSNSYIQFFSRSTPEGMVKYGSTYLNKEAEKAVPGITKTTDDIAKSLSKQNEKNIDTVINELQDTNISTLQETVFKDGITETATMTKKAGTVGKVSTNNLYKQPPLIPDVENYIVDKLKGIVDNTYTSKELPSKKLSDKILNYLKPKDGPAKSDPVRDMVNTLFKVAKESLPPAQRGKATIDNAIQTIADAVKYRKNYIKVWEEAQKIIEKRFANNPEALAKIKDFNEKVLFPTYKVSDKDRLIKNLLAQDGEKITDIIKKHYTEIDRTGQTLAEKLVSKTNLTGDDAQILEIFTVKRFKELASEAKNKELDRLFTNRVPTLKAKQRKELIDTLVEWSNLGAFNRSDLFDRIAGKLKIPHLPASLANDIYNRVKSLQEVDMSYLPSKDQARMKELTKYAIIKNVYEDIQRQNPLTTIEKLSLWQKSAALSRAGTQLGNLYTGFKSTFVDIPVTKALSNQIKDLPQYYKKVFKSIPSALEDAKIAFKGGALTAPDFRDVRLNIARDNPALDYMSTSLRVMEGVDKFFTRLIVEATDNPELADYFLKRTRPDSKNLKQGAVLRGIDSFTELAYSARSKRPELNFIIPFLQYGSNLFKQKLEFSPLGFLPWFQTKDGLQRGRAIIGTMASIDAWYRVFAADEDDAITLTGPAPTTEKGKQLFYGEGKTPYSFNIKSGGESYTVPLAYLEQYSLPYIAALTVKQNMSKIEKMTPDQQKNLMSLISESIFQTLSKEFVGTTGFASIDRLTKFISGDPLVDAQEYIGGIGSSFIPGFIDTINSQIDNVQRKREGFTGQFMAVTPGLSTQLEPYVGIYGEESKKGRAYGVLPYNIKKQKKDYLAKAFEPNNFQDVEAPVEDIYKEWRKQPVEIRKEYLDFLEDTNRAKYSLMTKLIGYEKAGVTEREQRFSTLGVANGERAEAIYKYYKQQGKDKNILLKLESVGIINDDVVKQLFKLRDSDKE